MKDAIYKIIHPNKKIIISGIFIIIFSLLYLICLHKFGSPEAYLLYLIMSYSLFVIVIKCYEIVNNFINKIITGNKILFKYKNDYKLRYKISLYISLTFNVIYAIFKLILGISYKSLWFIAFSLYYFLLVVLRANILKDEVNNKKTILDEWEKYRVSAITLLLMNVILTFIILIIVNEKIIIKYPVYIAIGVACYTFYITIDSIIKLIKYRKYKSPLIMASRVINIVTSLISMLSLEIVMLSTFGVDNVEFNEIMIMATGGVISIIIISICIYMIINVSKYLVE